jgi:pimeloyl-ACP methyl ester carboxylesterase
MDEIQHKYIQVNGLKLHVAEIGAESSPAVVFLHGFPEIWYSWRHQMIAVAKAGFRAITPEYRGYGLSDPPSEPEKTTFTDFVNDVHGIIKALGISKVFLVGKDFGALILYRFALCYPELVIKLISLGVPYFPPGPPVSPEKLPEGFYPFRWKIPGRAEADFARLDTKTVVRNIYILFSKSKIPIAKENQEVMDLVEPSTPLPSWITEEEFSTYADLYEKSGFRTALTVPYRSFDEPNIPGQNNISEAKIEAPTLLIMGKKDYVFHFPDMENYINSDEVNKCVPNLEIIYVPEGSHFVQEQFPDEINQLILTFLSNKNES